MTSPSSPARAWSLSPGAGDARVDVGLTRRRALASLSTAAGMLALPACKDDDDGPFNVAPPTSFADPNDFDLLNLTLTLKYLEAQFYLRAAIGSELGDELKGRIGVKGRLSGGRQVAFSDPIVADCVAEIAVEKERQVVGLQQTLYPAPRGNANLDSTVAMPDIDIGGGISGPFASLARAASIVGPGEPFDPYAGDDAFLLAAFFVTDVCVGLGRANIGIAKYVASADVLSGILAADAYHAATVRLLLRRRSAADPKIMDRVTLLSRYRGTLSGQGGLEQGLVDVAGGPNVVPTDAEGLVLARGGQRALNVLFLNSASVRAGGFFPSGINGTLDQSAAN